MSVKCPKCGGEAAEGERFCTLCGEPMPERTAPVQQTYVPAAKKDGEVSTGGFFGLMLLYAIPVIGIIVCIIMAFADKNVTRKHFARAVCIWALIGLVVGVACYFVFRSFAAQIIAYIKGLAGADLDLSMFGLIIG